VGVLKHLEPQRAGTVRILYLPTGSGVSRRLEKMNPTSSPQFKRKCSRTIVKGSHPRKEVELTKVRMSVSF